MNHTLKLLIASCVLLFSSLGANAQESEQQSSESQTRPTKELTAKELDLEAKQKAAEATGLDPTQVVGRVEFNYSYIEKKNGTERQSGILALDKDTSKKTVIGMEIPIATAKLANGEEQNGIGDVKLQIRHLAFVKGKFVTSFGSSITLDTASEDQLGDNANAIGVGMFNAWKHGEWLVANITSVKVSEDENYDSVSLSPIVAYQPMGEYLSYVRLAGSYVLRTDSGDSITNAYVNLGKVMPNKDVYSFGTKFNISGPDDDDFVLFLGYRRLF
ncbi:hypothetical protein [Thalassomonas sp. M1454]|uniref:hypothetical protein n=1 Tax=Thalassomonas sp. M1454 TaxID=2594477 RepID=UPI00117C9914|nr:hypothetical protein [Thalassomonas sp. M1454]TRX53166.1 hypothetical protein FNN08_14985 [Thalassomonas sp. M1454]